MWIQSDVLAGPSYNVSGDRLALFTRGGEEGQRDSNILRLYDIKRKNGRHPIFETELEAFPIVKKVHAGNPDNGVEPWVEYIEGEVTCSVFSPDGIYLAVARNDNEVHVYDSRNLGRGVLYRFCHQDPNRDTPGYRGYGIVEAQWAPNFDGRGLGLISGGNDGKVSFNEVALSFLMVACRLCPLVGCESGCRKSS